MAKVGARSVNVGGYYRKVKGKKNRVWITGHSRKKG